MLSQFLKISITVVLIFIGFHSAMQDEFVYELLRIPFIKDDIMGLLEFFSLPVLATLLVILTLLYVYLDIKNEGRKQK